MTPLSDKSSSVSFLAALKESQLLSPAQLSQIEADLQDQPGQQEALAELMLRREWLTPYQLEQIVAGNSSSLRAKQYRILDQLKGGNHCSIYIAEHVLMKRRVALKVVAEPDRHAPHLGSSSPKVLPVPSLVFLREVQAAARLNHPHVVTAYDAGEHEGRLFLVMEYVNGIDLHRLVAKRGALPVGLACELIRQSALALDYAHQQGMVHRDIKPGNLIVTLLPVPVVNGTEPPIHPNAMQERLLTELDWPLPPGCYPHVKVLDLGLACAVNRATGRADEDQLVGTPDYIAPELAVSSPSADIRSDIYSLGCSFYQLLTGHMPYPGDSWTEKIYRHRYDPVPSATLEQPDIPEAIASLLSRMMAKSPEDRPQEPQDIIDELEAWLCANGGRDHVPTQPVLRLPTKSHSVLKKRRMGLREMIIAILVGLILAAGARTSLQWLRSPEPDDPIIGKARTLRKQAPGTIGSNEPGSAPRFAIVRSHQSFASLPEAVQAAADGDTIQIQSRNAIVMGPLSLRGKRLTLESPDEPAELLFDRGPDAHPWEALITTSSPLTLRNLHLGYEKEGSHSSNPLLRCSGTSVRLERCRFLAPEHTSPLIFAHMDAIVVEDCWLQAKAGGISVETGQQERCSITVRRSRATMASANGAFITLWSPEGKKPGRVTLTLEDNRIKTGRLLAISSVSGQSRFHCHAQNNHFHCRVALISVLGCPKGTLWQNLIQWHGKDNTFNSADPGLLFEGERVSISGRFR